MSQLTVPQALSILQLQPGATQQQIRAAYKRLALKLHPDKHQRHLKQQHRQQPQQSEGSSVLPADPAAAFSLLSAAYELLSGSHHQPTHNSSSSSNWPSFEAAYAAGSLFSEALLDQAVLAGLAPADIGALQQLCTAAAAGQLAQQLAQQQPSQAEEAQWRQLYRQLTIKWQLEQLQQQQQQEREAASGVGLVELLSDLLLKAPGQVMVEVSEDEEEKQQQQQQPVCQGQSAGSCTAVTVAADCRASCHTQQLLGGTGCNTADETAAGSVTGRSQRTQQQPQQQQQLQHCQSSTGPQLQQVQQPQQQEQQQQQQWRDGRSKRQRHGLGFYWMWLRRLLLARAVLSVLSSKQRPSYDANLLAVL
jgi:hypothetical protein